MVTFEDGQTPVNKGEFQCCYRYNCRKEQKKFCEKYDDARDEDMKLLCTEGWDVDKLVPDKPTGRFIGDLG